MSVASNYGQQSISSLKDEDQVRKRPAVIFGTNDEKGCAHSVFEIIANAVDEAREGYGNLIDIKLFKDGTVEIADNGRGVPMGWNEGEKKFNWELVFCTLYASGKYDESSYNSSLGLNGLGATATQYASEFMVVESSREGKTSIMEFKKGRPVGQLKERDCPEDKSGTLIRFKPDIEVFTSIDVPVEYYIDKLRRQAMLQAGLKFKIYSEKLSKTIELYYEDGIAGFINQISPKQLIKAPISFVGEQSGYDDERDTTPYKVKMRACFTFSRDASLFEIYHNSSYLSDGGVTFDAFKAAMVKAVNEYARENGKLPKTDSVSYADIESILVAVADTNCPGNRTFFKHQTKTAITNPFIKNAYNSFVYHNFKTWLGNNKEGADRIVAEVLLNKQAREEADRVSKRVVQSLSKKVNSLGSAPDKFVNCKSRNIEEKELFIVEGDSALGACKQARDPAFQAIMPVRGKIINCLKGELSKVLASEIIVNLLRVFGCGVEAESKHIKDLPKFDIKKLDWGKIIICTDADLDGMHIRCLILTMIYRLVPTLLKEGKVFIAETPLYELIPKGKDHEAVFAYSEDEREKAIEILKSRGYTENQIKINRSKGLGENDPEMMSVSTMHPDTRRLLPVEYNEDNAETVRNMFNALLGDNIEDRKYLINEYFSATSTSID